MSLVWHPSKKNWRTDIWILTVFWDYWDWFTQFDCQSVGHICTHWSGERNVLYSQKQNDLLTRTWRWSLHCMFAFREVAYIRLFTFFVCVGCVGFRGVKIKKAEEAKTKKTPQDSALWPQTFFDNVWQRTSSKVWKLFLIFFQERSLRSKLICSTGKAY